MNNFYSPIVRNEYIFPTLLSKSCDNTGDEFQFKENIRIKVSISRENKKIFFQDFYNQVHIPNLQLFKTEDYSKNKLGIDNFTDYQLDVYKIEISFDESEIPPWIKNFKIIDNEYINWTLRVHSTQNVYFIMDKIKEDTEALMKDNWENENPGRKDTAKLARMKYQINNKQKNGGLLTREEEKILTTKSPKKIKFNINLDSDNAINSNIIGKENDYLKSEYLFNSF